MSFRIFSLSLPQRENIKKKSLSFSLNRARGVCVCGRNTKTFSFLDIYNVFIDMKTQISQN